MPTFQGQQRHTQKGNIFGTAKTKVGLCSRDRRTKQGQHSMNSKTKQGQYSMNSKTKECQHFRDSNTTNNNKIGCVFFFLSNTYRTARQKWVYVPGTGGLNKNSNYSSDTKTKECQHFRDSNATNNNKIVFKK